MINYTKPGTLNHFSITNNDCPNESGYYSANHIRFAQQIVVEQDVRSASRPFMVMDPARVDAAVDAWRHHLPLVKPFFSIQCNSDSVLLDQLARRPEVGFNCTTRQDVRLALDIVPTERLLYTNPCITNSTLSEARAAQVDLLSFESLGDLDRIARNHPHAEIILNIGSDASVEGDEGALDRVEELLQLAADMKCYCVGIGVTSFDDEYCLDPSSYPKAVETCRRLFEFGKKVGLPLRLINLGDIGYGQSVQEFARMADKINYAIRTNFPCDRFPDLHVIATPSRFFCEEAFSLVTRITDRHLVGANVVTNDEFDSGSDAYLYEVNEGLDSSFNCMKDSLKRNCYPLFPSDSTSDRRLSAVAVGSSLDAEWDMLQMDCELPLMHAGDWLFWPRMGAYSLSNVDSVDTGDEDLPTSVFYLATLGDKGEIAYARQPESIRRIHGEDTFRRQPRTVANNPVYDDGRGSSLGSDDETSSEDSGQSACSNTRSNDEIVPDAESKLGNEQWILDWLFNEFNQ